MKIKIAVTILCFFIALFFFLHKGFCHDANQTAASHFSVSDASNIKMWYDESWMATGFYHLERLDSTGPNYYNLRYAPVDDPALDVGNTFTYAPANVPDTDSSNDAFEDSTGGGSIPRDIVITEWEVTGHVHFQGGQP